MGCRRSPSSPVKLVVGLLGWDHGDRLSVISGSPLPRNLARADAARLLTTLPRVVIPTDSAGAVATREEWRDPDTVRFTMLIQGIYTRIFYVAAFVFAITQSPDSSSYLRASLENVTGSCEGLSRARLQRRQGAA